MGVAKAIMSRVGRGPFPSELGASARRNIAITRHRLTSA
ncbi:hypothetical protein [Pandoraea sp. XY-2]